MAINANPPKQTNWWVWGGGAAAVIVIVAALGYVFDWSGSGVSEPPAPAAQQPVPASD